MLLTKESFGRSTELYPLEIKASLSSRVVLLLRLALGGSTQQSQEKEVNATGSMAPRCCACSTPASRLMTAAQSCYLLSEAACVS